MRARRLHPERTALMHRSSAGPCPSPFSGPDNSVPPVLRTSMFRSQRGTTPRRGGPEPPGSGTRHVPGPQSRSSRTGGSWSPISPLQRTGHSRSVSPFSERPSSCGSLTPEVSASLTHPFNVRSPDPSHAVRAVRQGTPPGHGSHGMHLPRVRSGILSGKHVSHPTFPDGEGIEGIGRVDLHRILPDPPVPPGVHDTPEGPRLSGIFTAFP